MNHENLIKPPLPLTSLKRFRNDSDNEIDSNDLSDRIIQNNSPFTDNNNKENQNLPTILMKHNSSRSNLHKKKRIDRILFHNQNYNNHSNDLNNENMNHINNPLFSPLPRTAHTFIDSEIKTIPMILSQSNIHSASPNSMNIASMLSSLATTGYKAN